MTRKLPLRAAAPALLAFLAAASIAWAAPDRTAELTPAAPNFSWDGGPVTGVLNEDSDPDDTLVRLAVAGSLEVIFSEASAGAQDIDIQIFRSNQAGEPGAEVYLSEESEANETYTHRGLSAGYYLIRASGFLSAGGTYKGDVTLTPGGATSAPDGGPGPSGGGGGSTTGPDARPVARIGKVAKKVKASKLKGFKGTAADDRGVKNVQVALVLKKGRKCTQLNARGKFVKARCGSPTSYLFASGTSSWSFKLRKKLKKGSYTVFARATDTANQVQAKPAKASFKVR